jgi:MFS family permease
VPAPIDSQRTIDERKSKTLQGSEGELTQLKAPRAENQRILGPAFWLVAVRAASALGSYMTMFAMNLWMYDQTGSYALFAILSVAATAPGLVFSPFAGVIVDRISRGRLLILCEVISLVVVSAALMALQFHILSPVLLGFVFAVLSVMGSLSWPAQWATVTVFARDEVRARINGASEAFGGAILIIGPLLAVLLLEGAGLLFVVVIDMATYLLCIWIMQAVVFKNLKDPLKDNKLGEAFALKGVLSQAAVGFRWIFDSGKLLRLLILFAVLNFVCATYVVARTPYLLSFLDSDALGVLLSLEGVGLAIGGVAIAGVRRPRNPMWGVFIGCLFVSLCIAVYGVARSQLALSIIAVVYGLSVVLANASYQTLWQRAVPEELIGRVFTARKLLTWGFNPIAVFISIPLVDGLFAPLLALKAPLINLSILWGSGNSGKFGLLISALGLVAFLASLVWMYAGWRAAPVKGTQPGT